MWLSKKKFPVHNCAYMLEVFPYGFDLMGINSRSRTGSLKSVKTVLNRRQACGNMVMPSSLVLLIVFNAKNPPIATEGDLCIHVNFLLTLGFTVMWTNDQEWAYSKVSLWFSQWHFAFAWFWRILELLIFCALQFTVDLKGMQTSICILWYTWCHQPLLFPLWG